MENYTITKEQILELHESNSPETRIQIAKMFPDAFKKEFTVGKWYKIDKNIFYCTEISERGTLYGYGIFDGKWKEHFNDGVGCCACNSVASEDRLTEATPQEVETALIEEAKKRGYKKGVTIKGINSNTNLTLPNGGFEYLELNNVLWFGKGLDGYDIFRNGKWTDIVEETKEITMNKAVKILSKKYGKKVTIK